MTTSTTSSSTTDFRRLTGLVEIMASERTHTAGRPELFDDCVQEGLIAAWQATEKRPDAAPAYVHAAARNGVASPLRGRPLTGAPRQRGLAREDAMERSQGFTAAEEEVGEDWKGYTEDLAAAEALERVELSDVIDQVRAAVARRTGTDALILQLRAEGRTWPQIAGALGLKTEAVRRRFVDHLAPALRVELGHLAEFA